MNKVAKEAGMEGTHGPNSIGFLGSSLVYLLWLTNVPLAYKKPMVPSLEKTKHPLSGKLITLNPFYLKGIMIDLDCI